MCLNSVIDYLIYNIGCNGKMVSNGRILFSQMSANVQWEPMRWETNGMLGQWGWPMRGGLVERMTNEMGDQWDMDQIVQIM